MRQASSCHNGSEAASQHALKPVLAAFRHLSVAVKQFSIVFPASNAILADLAKLLRHTMNWRLIANELAPVGKMTQ